MLLMFQIIYVYVSANTFIKVITFLTKFLDVSNFDLAIIKSGYKRGPEAIFS